MSNFDDELNTHEQLNDPEMIEEIENVRREEKINDLYWTLINTCEELDLTLFNRLDSYYLDVWLKSNRL